MSGNRHRMLLGSDGRVTVNIGGMTIAVHPQANQNANLPGNMVAPLLAALCLELAELRARYDEDHGRKDGLVLKAGDN